MKIVVWDVDDVLNDLARRWFEDAWLPSHPQCKLVYGDLVENPPHRVLGVDLADYLASLDAYRLSPAAAALAPVPEVAAWFAARGDTCRHIALTARPAGTVAPAASWVFAHFGRWIRTFHYVPAFRSGETLPPYEASKEDALRWLGRGDALVDDCPGNVEGAQRLGVSAVLMPRPWNGGGEVAAALDRLSAALAG